MCDVAYTRVVKPGGAREARMVPLVAVGALGVLAWTGYRALRRELDRLEQEDDSRRPRDEGRLERDPETGRYRRVK